MKSESEDCFIMDVFVGGQGKLDMLTDCEYKDDEEEGRKDQEDKLLQ